MRDTEEGPVRVTRTDLANKSDGTANVDVVGVGLGPFNLGLAALLEPVEDVSAIFFEAEPDFAWHPGLMLTGTTLQVPFLADLVTLADPTSRYSFLNYLHEHDRLYRFYFYERFHVPRQEYDAYARWVAHGLPTCRFGHRVESVTPDGSGAWTVRVRSAHGAHTYRARSVVFGVGSRPYVPPVGQDLLGDDLFHAADYLTMRGKAIEAEAVTVVGSGQSAGEIVADLLETGIHTGQRLDWFTRSSGFFPMEYSKLGLEHFSPEYTTYFHSLPASTRDRVRAGQDLLYKGLSEQTSERIYDLLYTATIDRPDPPVTYVAGCELQDVQPSPTPGRQWRLTWHHVDEDRTVARDTDVVIFATGYRPAPLPVPDGLIQRDEYGRPDVSRDYRLRLDGQPPHPSSLFTQNAELHTHGVGTPDLGLGAYRNSVIVNALAGREIYHVPERTVFQRFGTAALDDETRH
ncbi:lysine 6-monooxygenase [Actinobacteria bacterium YIM 96077]|uniref:L-lysine N6-monooxygenase MbtG n=1 Tax=Phytoactinopolyspora halophila TaxID=1981511 RepID=A0A329QP35_9ACTN|nr:SidA/IucD/PvdA family monooxygenase [Phytoactinopolyspora halophila]AYY14610.1 lysine 6-monooxygenase [Actinobacteria bacterium YIM 96077]RAW14013.1 lysine 6-monooxygenase [Phytoactinopolyspora halophila]